jgi:hypothetical protein
MPRFQVEIHEQQRQLIPRPERGDPGEARQLVMTVEAANSSDAQAQVLSVWLDQYGEPPRGQSTTKASPVN